MLIESDRAILKGADDVSCLFLRLSDMLESPLRACIRAGDVDRNAWWSQLMLMRRCTPSESSGHYEDIMLEDELMLEDPYGETYPAHPLLANYWALRNRGFDLDDYQLPQIISKSFWPCVQRIDREWFDCIALGHLPFCQHVSCYGSPVEGKREDPFIHLVDLEPTQAIPCFHVRSFYRTKGHPERIRKRIRHLFEATKAEQKALMEDGMSREASWTHLYPFNPLGDNVPEDRGSWSIQLDVEDFTAAATIVMAPIPKAYCPFESVRQRYYLDASIQNCEAVATATLMLLHHLTTSTVEQLETNRETLQFLGRTLGCFNVEQAYYLRDEVVKWLAVAYRYRHRGLPTPAENLH